MQGEDTELNIYPEAIYMRHENLGECKLYRIDAVTKEQLLYIGRSGAADFVYLMKQSIDLFADTPQVQIKSIDEKVITENICTWIPKGRQFRIQAPFDGKVVILRNNNILDIRHILAEQIITADEISFGDEIQIFQSCDLVQIVKFEKTKENTNEVAADFQLVKQLRQCKGNMIPVPHSAGVAVLQLKRFPLTKEWLCSTIRQGQISQTAYWMIVDKIQKRR